MKTKANQNSSTPFKGTSPRVAAVLKKLNLKTWSQASLARAAGINRGVLNQLWQGRTSSSPLLIGRLCAVLDADDGIKLLAAYLHEVTDAIAEEEMSAKSPSRRGHIKAKVVIDYPPQRWKAA